MFADLDLFADYRLFADPWFPPEAGTKSYYVCPWAGVIVGGGVVPWSGEVIGQGVVPWAGVVVR